MAQLTFNMAVMQFLVDHRNVLLTKFFLLASFAGQVEGYILIVTLIYVMLDKTLAVRLAVLLLMTMCLNHVLKIILKNPRPFIHEGTYLQKWAVSTENAKALSTEYSTPSGHAMAGSAFYSYLYAFVENPFVRVIAVLAILATGFSRPYLGVHYPGDILIGWVIGLLVALVAIKRADKITDGWNKLSYKYQVAIAVASSMVLWLATIAINGWRIDGQPRAFLGYAGFLTGILIGRPIELSAVNFDPRSSTQLAKMLRFIISVAMVLVSLVLLDKVFRAIADDFSVLGYLLQYIRYVIAGVINIFVAPLFFTKLGLAETSTFETC
ncbi:MAG: phosphatase PAP2 family protein [Candidatus Binatus sp.]|jgi:membrane-associated phospholipid phosphatase|uniref:phosphatase PAP2 family protein n=1 Tax=Candidatus Binatus sp. TaxID=2811406 RepID=UPI003CBFE781